MESGRIKFYDTKLTIIELLNTKKLWHSYDVINSTNKKSLKLLSRQQFLFSHFFRIALYFWEPRKHNKKLANRTASTDCAQRLIKQRSANCHTCDSLLTLYCITYRTYDKFRPALCGTVQYSISDQAHSQSTTVDHLTRIHYCNHLFTAPSCCQPHQLQDTVLLNSVS